MYDEISDPKLKRQIQDLVSRRYMAPVERRQRANSNVNSSNNTSAQSNSEEQNSNSDPGNIRVELGGL